MMQQLLCLTPEERRAYIKLALLGIPEVASLAMRCASPELCKILTNQQQR